ncbi:hypothetical protein DCAR_0102445 [Daucus carota subsp. sativus]|uniref:UTP23 sensor motif region domain-containing protein n=1 Tax=Daucus carota subsp. sativus TaxID=79200 RepID=A0AAF0W4U5_DAUCS|nr:hypothetical protein DCAR_0102445 [Daucus carota subsp. sativus]
MRLKRQKRHGRTLRFFTACFGFGDPFKVLCDCTFIHHLVAHDINPVHTALSNVLGTQFISRCDHDKSKSAVDCITEIIGEIMQITSLLLHRMLICNFLLVEPLSNSQRHFAKSAEEEHLHLKDLELKMLNMKGYSMDRNCMGSEPVKLFGEKKKADLRDKGPNPLSCKKKKTKGNQNNAPKKVMFRNSHITISLSRQIENSTAIII